jgi:hypothetical protein
VHIKRENHTHNNAKSSKLGVLKKQPLKSKEKCASIELYARKIREKVCRDEILEGTC